MKGTPASPQCGFSRAVVQILDVHGVSPDQMTTYNCLEDPELREGIKEFSYVIPFVNLGGEGGEGEGCEKGGAGGVPPSVACGPPLTHSGFLPFPPSRPSVSSGLFLSLSPSVFASRPFLKQRLADDPPGLPQGRVRWRLRHPPRHAPVW